MVPWFGTALSAAAVAAAFFLAWKVFPFLYNFVRIATSLSAQGMPWVPPQLSDLTMKDTHRLGIAHAKKYGGIFWTQIVHCHVVIVSNPQLVAEVLDRTKTLHTIDKPTEPQFYRMLDEGTARPPTPSLISTSNADPYWRPIRKKTSHAFTSNNLKSAFDVSVRMSKRLVDTVKAQLAQSPDQDVDIDRAAQCQAFDVIGEFGFSKDYEATTNLQGKGAQACDIIKQAMIAAVGKTRNPHYRIPYTRPWHRTNQIREHLLDMFESLLKEVQARGAPSDDEHSIAAYLMRTKDENGHPIPRVRVWSEMSMFFFAGVETTGHTVAWAMYLISQYPEVEAKIAAELASLGLLATPEQPNPKPLEYADISKLTYLSCVIKESMRLYPVVPMIFRKAVQDVRIGSYLIPKGTFFVVHIMATHTLDSNWERAEEFLPERWEDPDCEYARWVDPSSPPLKAGRAAPADGQPTNGHVINSDDISSCATNSAQQSGQAADGGHHTDDAEGIKDSKVKRWLPFGDGNRACVGMPLAKINVIASSASLLSHFTFKLSDKMGGVKGVRNAETYNITLQPEHGIKMRCIPRAMRDASP